MEMDWESIPALSNKEVWRDPKNCTRCTHCSLMDQAIGSHRNNSKLIDICKQFKVTLWWLLWHINEELARQSSSKDIGDEETSIRAPFSHCFFALQIELIHIKVNRAWTSTEE